MYDNIEAPPNNASVVINGNIRTCTSRLNETQVVSLQLEYLSNGNVRMNSRDVTSDQSSSILKESFILDPVNINEATNTISSNTGDSYWLIPFDGSDPVDVSAPIGAAGLQLFCECCTDPGEASTGSCSVLFQPHPDSDVFVFRCTSDGCGSGCGMDWKKGIIKIYGGLGVLVKANSIG